MEERLIQEAIKIYGSHPPLDTSKHEIRLLSIDPSDDPGALLIGTLRSVTIEDNYAALSYVWGEWSDRSPIRLNGIDTTITANLATALRRLRSEGKAVNIWTDAVCINQTDNAEKGQQVAIMNEIYHSANLATIIWLGEEGFGSNQAMDFVSSANKVVFDTYDPESSLHPWEALGTLLRREWWKRMWVIQETMLSPNPIMKCGSKETTFKNFVEFRNLHWDAEQADPDKFRPLRNLWRDCPFAPLMWRNWREWVGGTLASWLVDMANFKCLYDRDKIYALLGLISKDSRDRITVEYDSGIKSDFAVFLEADVLCFRETGLLPLQQGQVEKDTALGMPSWCPDWTSKQFFVPFIGFGFSPFPVTTDFRPPKEKWLFGGDQEDKPAYSFSVDMKILFTHGFIVDIVESVDGVGTDESSEEPVYVGDDDEERARSRARRLATTKAATLRWEREARSSSGGPYPEGKEEAFCRTIIANRTFNKQKLKSNMKPTFDAWVGRGPSDSSTVSPAQIQDFSNSAVSLAAKRTFITTRDGRFGLAPQKAKKGDLVCILYSGEVAYILRKPEPEFEGTPGSFVGEAYIHGVMEGEYLDTAKGEDFTAFWVI